jgi:hypothetical protein
VAVDQYGNSFGVGDYVLITEVPSSLPYFAMISVVRVEKIEKNNHQKDIVYFERWYPIEQRGELIYRQADDCVVTTEHNYLVSLKRRDEWDKEEAKENG